MVSRLQYMLTYIAQFYPEVPELKRDGSFGSSTRAAVIEFQSRFGLNPDGVVGASTWNKIYEVYFASKGITPPPPPPTGPTYPGEALRVGSRGEDVRIMQEYLNALSSLFPSIPRVTADGVFGAQTESAVMAFQRQFGMTIDGIIGPSTWAAIVREYNFLPTVPPPEPPPEPGPVFPGTALRVGSRGEDVRIMQTYLNALSSVYPSIPRITADGIFGTQTENAVRAFQRQFGLNPDGIIGVITWNAIVAQYNRLPVSPPPTGPAYPGTPLRVGSRGENVRIMQEYLNALSAVFPSIPRITADGVFGPLTENAVRAFQRQFGLTADGIIGPITWSTIVAQYNAIAVTPPTPPYPGTPLRQGSTGENVRTLQTYINRLAAKFPSVPGVTVDGMFGPATTAAVIAAQRALGLTADGIVGPATWAAIVNNNPAAAHVIVLDPGHGGSDPGAVNGSRLEKNDNLRMGQAVRDLLQAQGQKVIMTRSSDVYVPLSERVSISNNNNAAIFVSLHRNAYTTATANGVETLVQTNSAPINTAYANNVHNEIVSVGVQSNRGVRQGNYQVLRDNRSPAMMVELGFITNEEDNRLFDQNFNEYAAAITRGILKSLN